MLDKIKKLTAVAGAMALAMASAASAQTYANTQDSSISLFGSSATPTYGQVFTAPGDILSSFTFYNDSANVAGETFAIASWNGTRITGVDLFSASSNIIGPDTAAGFFSHTVADINLALTSGSSYFAYFTTYNTPNAITGSTFEGSSTSPLGGGFRYSNSSSDPTTSTSFNSFFVPDLRYSATFVTAAPAVPEPATWAMVILGMGAIGFATRSAKRRSDDVFDAKIKCITEGAVA